MKILAECVVKPMMERNLANMTMPTCQSIRESTNLIVQSLTFSTSSETTKMVRLLCLKIFSPGHSQKRDSDSRSTPRKLQKNWQRGSIVLWSSMIWRDVWFGEVGSPQTLMNLSPARMKTLHDTTVFMTLYKFTCYGFADASSAAPCLGTFSWLWHWHETLSRKLAAASDVLWPACSHCCVVIIACCAIWKHVVTKLWFLPSTKYLSLMKWSTSRGGISRVSCLITQLDWWVGLEATTLSTGMRDAERLSSIWLKVKRAKRLWPHRWKMI